MLQGCSTATSALTPSELEHRRLRASRVQLDRRWTHLSNLLCSELGVDRRTVTVDADYQAEGVWAGLQGRGVERIARNRGSASVAPLATLADGLLAWLGFQEVWDSESTRAFIFRHVGLTVHIGELGDPIKPQLLRLEWPGLRDWDCSGVGFAASGAGHPHWQIDLFESLQDDEQPALTFLSGETVESFGDIEETPSILMRVRRVPFEEMHLASAAPWWSRRNAEFGAPHLNAPESLEDLSRWIGAAVNYMRQELARCSALRPARTSRLR